MRHLLPGIAIIFFSLHLTAQNQNVGIGTTTPDNSAKLEVQSTTQGMLVPRMTSAQRMLINSPATGLLVFDTDTGGFWLYDGTAWVDLSTRLTDADGDTKIQLDESADDDHIRFDVQGVEAMVLKPDGDLQIKGQDPDDAGFMELINGDTSQFVRLFGGRSGDPAPFIGWQLGSPFRFITSNSDYSGFTEHLRIQGDGNVGIGEQNPTARLHVAEGPVLLQGTYNNAYSGPLPASGFGNRLMWIPEIAAFRVGGVAGSQWDLASIGEYSSVAGGLDNKASGGASFVGAGFGNTASGIHSFAGGGFGNTASDSYAFVGAGSSNTASGIHSFTGAGFGNIASGLNSFAGAGESNTASSQNSFVGGGESNAASNQNSFVGGGFANTASGISSFVGGGESNTASGISSFVGGGTNNLASGENSFTGGGDSLYARSYAEAVFGTYNTDYSPNSINFSDPNDRLFVIGNGTFGNRSNAVTVLKKGHVGIGTDTPDELLHIVSGNDPTILLQSDGNDEPSGRVSLRQSNLTGFDIFYDGLLDELVFEGFIQGTSAGHQMTIDHSSGNTKTDGHIWGSRYAFTAYATDLFFFDQDTLITFNDFTDPYSLFDDSTNVFVAPRDGLYYFTTSVSFEDDSNSDDSWTFGFSINGSMSASHYMWISPRPITPDSGVELNQSNSVILSLVSGDSVGIFIGNVSSPLFNQVAKTRTFSGFYLGE